MKRKINETVSEDIIDNLLREEGLERFYYSYYLLSNKLKNYSEGSRNKPKDLSEQDLIELSDNLDELAQYINRLLKKIK